MVLIGNIVIYIIMACAIAGAIAAIRNSESGLGGQFMEGIHQVGHIFVPAAGIMASIPYLSWFIDKFAGPFFEMIGADPAIAATAILASDMGGYPLADVLKESYEGMVLALTTGFMAGATIVFSIPMGLALLDKRDHKYMALGIMSGVLTIPIGVFITGSIMVLTNSKIREVVSTSSEAAYAFSWGFGKVLLNISPLFIFVVLIALGLYFLPDMMIKGFMWFGRIMDAGIKLVLVFSIVEIFTGVFSSTMGWGFDPIMADQEDQFRALETAGYIGIMLAGAFPMVYLLRKYFSRPLEAIGKALGLSKVGSAGLVATIANILAMYKLVRDMPPKDKVLNIAFGVCAAFLLGDHLSFTANFQPTLILPILIGKLSAGVIAIGIAYWISVPKARELEVIDRKNGVIGKDEYKNLEEEETTSSAG